MGDTGHDWGCRPGRGHKVARVGERPRELLGSEGSYQLPVPQGHLLIGYRRFMWPVALGPQSQSYLTELHSTSGTSYAHLPFIST